jgi:hypothetical protein
MIEYLRPKIGNGINAIGIFESKESLLENMSDEECGDEQE